MLCHSYDVIELVPYRNVHGKSHNATGNSSCAIKYRLLLNLLPSLECPGGVSSVLQVEFGCGTSAREPMRNSSVKQHLNFRIMVSNRVSA